MGRHTALLDLRWGIPTSIHIPDGKMNLAVTHDFVPADSRYFSIDGPDRPGRAIVITLVQATTVRNS